MTNGKMNAMHHITNDGITNDGIFDTTKNEPMDSVDAWSPQSHDGWMDSISAPVDSRVWTGGVWLEKSEFNPNASLHDSYVDRRHHRGAHVDLDKLRFTSTEEKAHPKSGFGGFLLFGQAKSDDEEESSDYRSNEPEIDIDAILKDTTIQPSAKRKNEGIGIDMFFRNFCRQDDPIRSDESVHSRDSATCKKKQTGLLGAMLDGASVFSTATPSVSEYTFTSSKSDRERSDKRLFMIPDDLSVLSDHTPNPSNHSGRASDWDSVRLSGTLTGDSRHAPSLLNAADDGSIGEVPSEKGSESSWEPCDDIWDEEQDQTVKKVEMERRVATKRTGKELWQIVRDNRRVLIGKSLRFEDIIMMAKRPWRKEPLKSFPERVASAREEQKDSARPEDESTRDKKSSKSSKKKKEKREKKHRSSSEKRSKSGRKKTEEERYAKSEHSVTSSSIAPTSKHSVTNSSTVTTIDSSWMESQSTRHTRGVKPKNPWADISVAPSMDRQFTRHARKTQRSTSQRLVTEHSLSSPELCDMLSPRTEFRSFLDQDRIARSDPSIASSTKERQRSNDLSAPSSERDRRRNNDHSVASSTKERRRSNDPSVASERDRRRSKDPSAAPSTKERRRSNDPSVISSKRDRRRSNDPLVASSTKERRRSNDSSVAPSRRDRRISNDPSVASSTKERRQNNDPSVASSKRDRRRSNDPSVASSTKDRRRSNDPSIAPSKRDRRRSNDPSLASGATEPRRSNDPSVAPSKRDRRISSDPSVASSTKERRRSNDPSVASSKSDRRKSGDPSVTSSIKERRRSNDPSIASSEMDRQRSNDPSVVSSTMDSRRRSNDSSIASSKRDRLVNYQGSRPSSDPSVAPSRDRRRSL